MYPPLIELNLTEKWIHDELKKHGIQTYKKSFMQRFKKIVPFLLTNRYMMHKVTTRRIRQRQFSQMGLELSDEENQIMLDILRFNVNTNDYNSYVRALGFVIWVLDQNRKYSVYNQELLNMVFSRCISKIPYSIKKVDLLHMQSINMITIKAHSATERTTCCMIAF
jgi:hypothetical protein